MDHPVIGKNIEEIIKMGSDLKRERSKVGLKINDTKSMLMTNEEGTEPIRIDDLEINRVREYKYLGQIISLKGGPSKEISTRITNSWKAFLGEKNSY